MTDSVHIGDADFPIWCALCADVGRLALAVAFVGGDSVCDDHLDGYSARADLQLEALERWQP